MVAVRSTWNSDGCSATTMRRTAMTAASAVRIFFNMACLRIFVTSRQNRMRLRHCCDASSSRAGDLGHLYHLQRARSEPLSERSDLGRICRNGGAVFCAVRDPVENHRKTEQRKDDVKR